MSIHIPMYFLCNYSIFILKLLQKKPLNFVKFSGADKNAAPGH